jgi:hypothetical protein
MLPPLRDAGFDILALNHARAILEHDAAEALRDLEDVFGGLSVPIGELVASGGGEAKLTQRLRRGLAARGWNKETIEVKKLVNGREIAAVSHEIDHVKRMGDTVVALEIEWNNKDPFFDRDLESFKRLHGEGALSVGVISTRGRSLQAGLRGLVRRFADRNDIASFEDLVRHGYEPTKRQRKTVADRMQGGRRSFREAWVDAFVADKFGEATTHWRKLEDRVHRGVANPCPLLLLGIPASVVTF